MVQEDGSLVQSPQTTHMQRSQIAAINQSVQSVTHLSSRGEILSAFDPSNDLDFGLKMAQEANKPLLIGSFRQQYDSRGTQLEAIKENKF